MSEEERFQPKQSWSSKLHDHITYGLGVAYATIRGIVLPLLILFAPVIGYVFVGFEWAVVMGMVSITFTLFVGILSIPDISVAQ